MNKKFKQPLVCIVIVNWNGGEKIKRCLRSLKQTAYKNYKVILVDNGSDGDSISELLEINPKMDVIKLNKNYGYTVGTNRGWAYSLKKYEADYICAMDSDIVTIQPNWLDLEIQELEKKEDYGIACGKLIFEDGRVQLLFLGRNPGNWTEKDSGQYDFVQEVPAVGGACILIKSEVIKKIGYYDENFFYGPNDLDYCLRAGKVGFKTIYYGKAKIIHLGSSSYKASQQTKIFEAQCYGNLLFQLRHFGKKAWCKMAISEIPRLFLTRKNPYQPIAINNINIHWDFLGRSVLLCRAMKASLKNKDRILNNIKNG